MNIQVVSNRITSSIISQTFGAKDIIFISHIKYGNKQIRHLCLNFRNRGYPTCPIRNVLQPGRDYATKYYHQLKSITCIQ